MKEKILNILKIKKKINNYEGLIFEKENDILSCIKSINEEGVKLRQKKAAISLLDLKRKKGELEGELVELCKAISYNSYNNKKANSKLISTCISLGITKEQLRELKNIYLNF